MVRGRRSRWLRTRDSPRGIPLVARRTRWGLFVRLLPELRARQVSLELERQPLVVRLMLAPGVRHQHQGAARAIRNDPGGPHARRADRPDCVTREPHPQHGWLQQLERRLPPGFALMSDIAVRRTAPLFPDTNLRPPGRE